MQKYHSLKGKPIIIMDRINNNISDEQTNCSDMIE
jgi:hypothetical protein